MTTRPAWLAVLAAAAVLPGCGGSDDPAPTAGPLARPAARHAAHPQPRKDRREGHAPKAARSQRTAAPARGERSPVIARADRICGDVHREVGRIARRLGRVARAMQRRRIAPKAYFAATAALTQRSYEVAARGVERLRALGGGDPHFARYLTAAGAQTELLHGQADALRAGDVKRVHDLNTRLAGATRRLHALAVATGFHVCGGAGASR